MHVWLTLKSQNSILYALKSMKFKFVHPEAEKFQIYAPWKCKIARENDLILIFVCQLQGDQMIIAKNANKIQQLTK